MSQQHGLTYLDIPSHRSQFHYYHAEQLLKDGNNYFLELERILKELNRAANLTPDDSRIYIALAEVYRRALDTSSAIFALRFALEKDPTNNRAKKQLCELLINRAQETMKLGTHYDRASNYFDDALEMDPTRPNIWILKSVCNVHCQNFPDALHAVNRAINISSEITIDMYILRAKILWAMGQIDAGNKDMRKVIAIDNSHPEVKAFIHRAFANAEKQYLEAYHLFQEKKSLEAIKILQSILEINQNDVKLYLLLSKCYRQNGDLEMAYKTLTNATKIYNKLDPYRQYSNLKIPDEIPLQQNIILNEMALQKAVEGEYDQAIILLNKAIASERKLRKTPNEINYRYFLNRGDCYRALGESLYAVTDYQLALERCPGNWDITTKLSLSYYNLAVESFNASQYRDCKHHIEGAMGLNPKIHEYYSLKGKAEYYLGEYHEAYEDYKRCLELNPENEEIKMRIMQFDKEMNFTHLDGSGGAGGAGGAGGGGSSSTVGPLHLSNSLTATSFSSSSSSSSAAAGAVLKPSHPSKVTIPLPQIVSSGGAGGGGGSSSALPTSLSVSYCTSLLPSVNPYLTQTMISSELLKEKRKQLNRVIHESNTTIDGKNELWKIMEDVKILASQYREPLKVKKISSFSQEEEQQTHGGGGEEDRDGEQNISLPFGVSGGVDVVNNKNMLRKKSDLSLQNKKKYIPVTAVALKRRSEEISKRAKLNPIVQGLTATVPEIEEFKLFQKKTPATHSSYGVKLSSSRHRLGRKMKGHDFNTQQVSQSHSQLLSLSLSSTQHSRSSGQMSKRVIRVVEND